MSLSFKTVNLFSSTYCTITQEQIQQVLIPVSIILTEEQIIEPESTGPQVDSASSSSAPSTSEIDVLILDNIPYITKDDVAVTIPGGQITVGELTAEIIRAFQNDTYAGAAEGILGGKIAFQIQGEGPTRGGTSSGGGSNSSGTPSVPGGRA